MNGPDLRFLADRASALEDRTHERLVEVHGRIAVARERRRTGAALGAAGLVVALVVGMAVVQRGQNRNSPDPAPKPTTTATVGSDAAPPPPAQGTCWAVPPELVASPEVEYDDSHQVPCTEPHTTETVSTFTLSEPTAEEATPTGASCGNNGGEYLNIDNESWILWGAALFLPSKEQVADGASWVRCDAFIPGPWWDPVDQTAQGARTMTTSMKDLADQPTEDLWTCLAQPPTQVQPTSPCDQPHAYEATGTLAGLGGLPAYPSEAVLRTEAQEDCGATVPRSLAGASVTAVWDPREDFRQGLIRGVCFMYRSNGDLLPPR